MRARPENFNASWINQVKNMAQEPSRSVLIAAWRACAGPAQASNAMARSIAASVALTEQDASAPETIHAIEKSATSGNPVKLDAARPKLK
jgi:hypothetical protein